MLGSDISWLYALQAGVDWNLGVLNISSNANRQQYFVIHKFRWLWYRGEGQLELFGDPANSYDLSSDAWATALDLDSVGFLHYGDFYLITGVTWALETRDA